MEARAVVTMVAAIHDTGIADAAELVTDDDSSTRANLKCPYSKLVTSGIWTKKDWPRNAKGKYLDDKGKLPLRVHSIDKFLADPAHQCKSFG